MLNLYSAYSALNVRRLCALLCPAISFLHFHVLQFHVLQVGPSISRPSFSRPAFSAPPLRLLHQLHWLPIESRICYKLCSLMYRVNHNTAPSYLSEQCVPCSDTPLRSTTRGNFWIPRTHRHLANRAFDVAAPFSWNSFRDSESYSNFFPN